MKRVFSKIQVYLKNNQKVISICTGIILGGIVITGLLLNIAPPPVKKAAEKKLLQVEVIAAEKKDYPVFLKASGEAGSIRVVNISPEISGKVVLINSRLESGEIIQKGQLLFKIDSESYETTMNAGKRRLKILERSCELAQKEFERVKRLYGENKVGSVSGVDSSEKKWIAAADTVSQVAHIVENAEISYRRCFVYAAFTGRLKNVAIESGQFVTAGKRVLTLIDDTVLEIHAQLNSADVGKWLAFEERVGTDWFTGLKQEECIIIWPENPAIKWAGVLHRIVEYDRLTRTVILAIRTEGKNLTNETASLVEGMYCSVIIPGKQLKDVVKLPRAAVSIENTVYTAVSDRLKTVVVNVVRSDDDYVYVNNGISDNDRVILNRLIDPLEGTPVSIVNNDKS